MIICDGPCKQSYHLHCLHLKQNPSEDTYICPICRYNKYKSTNITCYDIQHGKLTINSVIDFVHQYECENDLNEDIDISAIESTLGHTEKNKRVDDSDDRSDDKRRKTSKSPQGRFSDKKEGKMNRKKRRFAREDSDESSSTSITRSNDEQSEDKEDNENPSEPVVTRSGRKVIPRLLTDPFNLYYTNKDTRVSHRHKEDDSEESDDEMSDDQEEQDSASKVNVKEEQQSSQSGSVTSEEETVSSSDDGTTESEESEASSPSESDSEQKYEFGGRKKQEEEDDDDNFTLHHRKPKTKKLSKFDKSKVKKIVDILTNRKLYFPSFCSNYSFIVEIDPNLIVALETAQRRALVAISSFDTCIWEDLELFDDVGVYLTSDATHSSKTIISIRMRFCVCCDCLEPSRKRD